MICRHGLFHDPNLTVDTSWGLTVAAEGCVLRRTRRRIQAGWALEMGRYTLRWAIRRGRGETWATLSGSASHDTLEEVGRAMAD